MINFKDYIKSTLAILALVVAMKYIHGLIVKYIKYQYKLLDNLENWGHEG